MMKRIIHFFKNQTRNGRVDLIECGADVKGGFFPDFT